MTHKTRAGEARKEADEAARRLRIDEEKARSIAKGRHSQDAEDYGHEAGLRELEAEDLRVRARMEDLNVWKMTKTRETANGQKKSYTYWYASWREKNNKVRNVYLGSTKRVSKEKAMQKAEQKKKEALGVI